MELNTEQHHALDLLKSGKNVFLTGPAGTGKTTIIKHFTNYCKLKNINIALTSTTGVSALLINGTTIHSFSGIFPNKPFKMNSKIQNNWKNNQCIVIDEISMLGPDLLELLDRIAKQARNDYFHPFGGIQIIATGDFAQLPPVADKLKFCFESPTFNDTFENVYLTQNMRQSDKQFQDCLEQVRLGNHTEETINIIKERITPPVIKHGIIPTILFPIRKNVDIINNKEIDKLLKDSKENIIYKSVIRFQSELPISESRKNLIITKINKMCPAHDILNIPIGLQVMINFNIDIENRIVNGTRGVVIQFNLGNPVVRLLDGREIVIHTKSWDLNINSKLTVSKIQLPLIPAYALTIHKCQGATLDTAQIDIGSSIFEHGQTYTALSRVKSLENLYLINFDPKKIICNDKVKEFYKIIKQAQ